LTIAPEISGVDLERVDLVVDETPAGYRVVMPGGKVIEGNVEHVVGRIGLHALLTVEEEAPAAPIVHGASVWANDRRAVILGTKGTGKSTLAIHLLTKGIAVEGDEHVVVREHDVIARPRPISLKGGSLGLLPESVAQIIRACPSDEIEGVPLYIVAPSVLFPPWRIRAGGVDHLVFAEPNHGGESTIAPLTNEEAFSRLMADTWLPERQQSVAVARLRRLAFRAKCWRLRLGDLDAAERCIRQLLER
jgi:hypothetical protein